MSRIIGLFIYSYLSDSIGSSRAAFHAGNRPNMTPIPTLATKPAMGAHSGTYDGMINFIKKRQQPADKQPDNTAESGQRRCLDQELKKNIALLCTDRFTNAYLSRPLSHRHEHDVHYADAADHQSDRRNDDHCQKHSARDRLELIDQGWQRSPSKNYSAFQTLHAGASEES